MTRSEANWVSAAISEQIIPEARRWTSRVLGLFLTWLASSHEGIFTTIFGGAVAQTESRAHAYECIRLQMSSASGEKASPLVNL